MATAKKSRILAEMGRKVAVSEALPKSVLGLFAISVAGAITAMAIPASGRPDPIPAMTAIESLEVAPQALESPGRSDRFFREDRVLKNDTLGSLLHRLGVTDPGAHDFLRTASEARSISQQIRPGKIVSVETDGSGNLLRMIFPLNDQDSFVAVERGSSGYSVRKEAPQVTPEIVVRSAEIRTSLFAATDAAGIPDAIAVQIADIFGSEVDFHRELQKGDRLAVVYEIVRQRGLPVRSGRVLSAEFKQGKRTLQAYFFRGNDTGSGGYFDASGKSLRKAFLRSPLEFSRVTSGFSGARFHPVLKEWRAHRGVDYGAPIGTRVRATSDGIVSFAGRQGGYGNLVLLRHGGSYSTAYGHLNGFAPGLRVGARVQQGDLIGFVGRTGLASGPHLHYEFRVGEQQVNPLTIALPEAAPLDGSQLSSFMEHKRLAAHQLALADYRTLDID